MSYFDILKIMEKYRNYGGGLVIELEKNLMKLYSNR
jgi:hypothetical protein